MHMITLTRAVKLACLMAIIWLGTGAQALAQTGTRTVTITYEDKVNPAGTVYNILRATGLCTGTPTFATIATAVTVFTYQDKTAQIGNNYCYAATATYNGTTSALSNTALATILPNAPGIVNVQVATIQLYVPPREGLVDIDGLFGIHDVASE